MKYIFKRYWWLLLLIVVVLTFGFFPEIIPFIEKKESPKSDVVDAATYNPLERISKLDIKDSSLNGFVPVIEIQYHVAGYKEINVEGDAFEPRVSPDGTKILFIKKSGARTQIAFADLIQKTSATLNIDLEGAMHPAWNADGTKIVFAGIKGKQQEVYTYELASKKLFQVTKASQRKPGWPRFSPFTFNKHYRIAYVSQERGRKDIWWIRENGEDDRPITIPPDRVQEFMNPDRWKNYEEAPKNYSTTGGEFPEWSPSGEYIIYHGENSKNLALRYDWSTWWRQAGDLTLPIIAGHLFWAPNQSSFISYNQKDHSASFLSLDKSSTKKIAENKSLTSGPAFFPDGKGIAYTFKKDGKSVLAVEPLDDPLGDVANLWLFKFNAAERKKLSSNHLQIKETHYDQMYSLYESELYQACDVPAGSDHRRPYLVTTDAVMETFYASFSALLGYFERVELKSAIEDLSTKGLEAARTKKAPKEIEQYFLTGLALIQPEAVRGLPPEVKAEIERIKSATGKGKSLFDIEINYADFLIRGKYERDTDLQGFFQALKWYQVFQFKLEKPEHRKWLAALLDVIQTPNVHASIERIHFILKDIIGESRYYGPVTLKSLSEDGKLPDVKTTQPWITLKPSFKLLPFIYTMDAFIFDELITHTDRAETVGTSANPRGLPVGMDIMGAFGSTEAKKILLDEFKENRYEKYEKKLDEVTNRIKQLPANVWEQNLYSTWLGLTKLLVSEPPAKSPDFTKTKAWSRKNLNTALGSWVNLRYETVAYVEQVAAECGEAGYELMNIGYPRGYVEPNPVFFQKLDDAFGKVADRFATVIKDEQLRNAVIDRIGKYRKHLKNLGAIAQKELDNTPLTDNDYAEIYYIGRTVEHFVLIMNSLSPVGHGLAKPDPIMKVVDVQKFELTGETLYEALGYANEIDVIVPYFGRRQIVKGSVYSYYEFRSNDVWKNEKWREDVKSRGPVSNRAAPIWMKEYY